MYSGGADRSFGAREASGARRRASFGAAAMSPPLADTTCGADGGAVRRRKMSPRGADTTFCAVFARSGLAKMYPDLANTSLSRQILTISGRFADGSGYAA
jgi:hypothetical protein